MWQEKERKEMCVCVCVCVGEREREEKIASVSLCESTKDVCYGGLP